jgi:hypothetical protein
MIIIGRYGSKLYILGGSYFEIGAITSGKRPALVPSIRG